MIGDVFYWLIWWGFFFFFLFIPINITEIGNLLIVLAVLKTPQHEEESIAFLSLELRNIFMGEIKDAKRPRQCG